MKNLLPTLLLLLLSSACAMAQRSLIVGSVSDSSTATPLPGATVYLEGTTIATATNIDGSFVLNTAASGDVVLVISYIGYNTVNFPVNLEAGSTRTVDVKLSATSGQLSEIIITGTLQGEAKALNQQRAAGNIKNIVAADQIGRFPDPNAAEALQRVQGVNIERDQGEGRYVLIRGLAPQFTNININGEQIPSPEADVRYVALDAVPSDQLASMEIVKSLTPDLDGDAIGGSVNLITRTATSSSPTVRASLVGGFNNLMGKTNVQGSSQYGQRFLNNKLGVMVNSSYYSNNLGSNNWERDTRGDLKDPSNDEAELRDYELTRTRTGQSSTIDYKFNSQHEIYGRVMYNRFSDREWRRRYVFVPEDDEVEKLTKDRYETQTIATVNLGGRHSFKKFRVDYEASIADAEQDTPYDNEVGFIASDMATTLDFTSNKKQPGITTSPSYLNNSLFEFDELATGNTIAKDRNLTAKVNVEVPYALGSSSGILKVGGKVRKKTKSFKITQNYYGAIAGVPTLNAFEGGTLDDNFLGGDYKLSSFADVGKFITYFNANPQQFEVDFEGKIVDEALESYEATEDVMAAYAMTTHQFKKLTVVAGLRYEGTQVNYKSSEVIFGNNGDLAQINSNNQGTNYDYLLPQMNLRYEIDKNTILRGAATMSYARPNFSDIVPAQETNLSDREASIGNANIKPVSALNLDLMGEKYLDNLGIISLGVYYKKLDDFIFARRFLGPYPLNSTSPTAPRLLYSQAQNGDVANLLGLETGIQRQLDFLPGVLKYMALYVNYTYTSSAADFQRTDAPTLERTTLPGQAAHVGNFALGFNSKKLTLRASLNFNGSYLSEIGASKDDDIFIRERVQIDFTAGYKLNNTVRFFAEFLNITNQPFETYSGTADNFTQREFYSWWSRVGVKFDLN